jgi:hypothetical protein
MLQVAKLSCIVIYGHMVQKYYKKNMAVFNL